MLFRRLSFTGVNAEALKCPYCQSELELPDNAESVACEECGEQLNVAAQLAYARAKTAFLAAQNRIFSTPAGRKRDNSYRARAKPNLDPLPPDVVRDYQHAYTALNIAFQYELPESQKHTGIEMMAEMTRAFAPRAIISEMEAEYWTKLMMVVSARDELQSIEERLKRPAYKGSAIVARWRMQLRRYQLTRAITKLDVKIRELERMIGFLDPPHVR